MLKTFSPRHHGKVIFMNNFKYIVQTQNWADGDPFMLTVNSAYETENLEDAYKAFYKEASYMADNYELAGDNCSPSHKCYCALIQLDPYSDEELPEIETIEQTPDYEIEPF